MIKHLSTLFCAIALIALSSCSGSKQTADANDVSALTVDDLLASAPELVDSVVTFEGVCSHTCKHGATKIFLLGTDDTKTIRVEACDLGSFDTRCIHRPVTVTGIVREQRIDEPFLASWEERTRQAQTENHEAGCETERNAHGVEATTAAGQIAEYRARIAERDSLEGKPYLSFYYVDAQAYEIGE